MSDRPLLDSVVRWQTWLRFVLALKFYVGEESGRDLSSSVPSLSRIGDLGPACRRSLKGFPSRGRVIKTSHLDGDYVLLNMIMGS